MLDWTPERLNWKISLFTEVQLVLTRKSISQCWFRYMRKSSGVNDLFFFFFLFFYFNRINSDLDQLEQKPVLDDTDLSSYPSNSTNMYRQKSCRIQDRFDCRFWENSPKLAWVEIRRHRTIDMIDISQRKINHCQRVLWELMDYQTNHSWKRNQEIEVEERKSLPDNLIGRIANFLLEFVEDNITMFDIGSFFVFSKDFSIISHGNPDVPSYSFPPLAVSSSSSSSLIWPNLFILLLSFFCSYSFASSTTSSSSSITM